jgi:hypothetical protein
MLDEKQLDPQVQIRYYKAWGYGGFGLWWFMIGAPLLFEEYFTDTAIMILGAGWLAYALYVIAIVFFTGYSKEARKLMNKDDKTRKENIAEVWWSAGAAFLCMMAFKAFFRQGPWIEHIMTSVLVSLTVAIFMYIVQIRKPRIGRK